MTDKIDATPESLEKYRDYLMLLARMQVDGRWDGKIDLSGVVQQTLLEANMALATLSALTPEQQAGWLRTALGRNLIDETRRLGAAVRDVRREQSLEDSLHESSARLESWLSDGDSSPSDRAIRNEELLRLAHALAQLTDDQRRAIELHHLAGRPVSELAEEMGRSPGAVGALLVRGVKRLRELMREGDS